MCCLHLSLSLYFLPQVESFILDQEDLENPIMKTASELLLSSATDGVDLRTVDPETQARLEALLEAAGTTSKPPPLTPHLDTGPPSRPC